MCENSWKFGSMEARRFCGSLWHVLCVLYSVVCACPQNLQISYFSRMVSKIRLSPNVSSSSSHPKNFKCPTAPESFKLITPKTFKFLIYPNNCFPKLSFPSFENKKLRNFATNKR